MSVTPEVMADKLGKERFWHRLSAFDWGWAGLVVLAAVLALMGFGEHMNRFDTGILLGTVPGMIALGWYWKPFRALSMVVAGLSLFAIWRYDALLDGQMNVGAAGLDQAAAQDFFLKFLVSSQSATMWMSALFVLATAVYFLALFSRSDFVGRVASAITWAGTGAGLVGLMVRWRESYLINVDYGHIPVSNLYEVFILFAVMTAMLYLYYEARYQSRNIGGFVMLVVSAAVGFLLWYTFEQQAHAIQPLVPALNSYWMKIHVPANFIGYGTFALAAMVGVAYLIKARMGGDGENDRLPSLAAMDDLMYKSIALGFAFFTIATILGAMWAAEAWGGYWSWDPKETWALIVWLNYAAWLHLRLTKGWRGKPMAWWAVIGLFITSFAFLGVNMFLTGLHSYGEL